MIKLKQAMDIGMLDPSIRKRVAMELQCSWPAPMADSILFFYYARFGPPPAETDALYPPSWAAWISWDDGHVLKVEKMKPAYFGIAGKPDIPFAQHAFPAFWTLESVNRMKARLFDCMDVLYPEWRAGSQPDRDCTMAFRALFPDLATPPLMVCYRHIAPQFFSWIGM